MLVQESVVKPTTISQTHAAAVCRKAGSQDQPGHVWCRGKNAFENGLRRNGEPQFVPRPSMDVIADLKPFHLLVGACDGEPPVQGGRCRFQVPGLMHFGQKFELRTDGPVGRDFAMAQGELSGMRTESSLFEKSGELLNVCRAPGLIVQNCVFLEFFSRLAQDLPQFNLSPGCRMVILFTGWFWAKPTGR